MGKQGGVMAYSYNLLKEPWLPCLNQQDENKSFSIVDALIDAHRIKSIESGLPIIKGSLYLFLLAFIWSVYSLEDDNEWENLWKEGKFSKDKIQSYAVRWEDRFDLFDAHHPFYQDPKLGSRKKDVQNLKKDKAPVPKAISGLLLHLSSGSNATLFNHSMDDLPETYSPSQAARLLIMLQAFSLGGMSSASIAKDRYYKDSLFGRGVLFLNRGSYLFETLMLNMLPKNSGLINNSIKDRPAWEQDDPFEDDHFSPEGPLDLLTWQSRRILYIPHENQFGIGLTNFYAAPGHGVVDTYQNPFYQYRLIKAGGDQSFTPLRFRVGRSLWRDSTAILNTKSDELIPAFPVAWSQHLKVHEIFSRNTLFLDLFGMCTEPGQKKAYFYAHETFAAPSVYLQDRSLLSTLERDLDLAKSVSSALYIAVRELARFKLAPMHDQDNSRIPVREDTDPLMQHWNTEFLFWSKLEPAFYDYLVTLPKSEDEAFESWEQALKKSARETLNYAIAQVGTDPSGLKAGAIAGRTLNSQLHKIFNPSEEE